MLSSAGAATREGDPRHCRDGAHCASTRSFGGAGLTVMSVADAVGTGRSSDRVVASVRAVLTEHIVPER